MEEIRLYRQFYSVINDVYTLIDPFFLSASTKNINSISIIEELIPIQESLGIYYVSMNPKLYSFSDIYELNWFVNYIDNSPQKRLPTKFKINPVNIGGGGSNIQIQVENSPITIEIVSSGT